MGTPDFAVPTLLAVLEAGHEVAAVLTQPPRPAGRGKAPRPSPIQRAGEQAGLRIMTPKSLKGAEIQETIAALGADVGLVVAYGLILPRAVLEAPREGCFNLHASLLPRWRGAAPIQRAIMAGDRETGIAVMRMEEGLDTGPICAEERVPIPETMTAGELHDILAERGARLMVEALAHLEAGRLDCRPQAREGVTYARKIEKAETRIDFSRPARAVHDHIRALSPFPGAWFEVPRREGGRAERVKVLRSEVAEAGRPGAGKAAVPGEVLDDRLTIACGEGAVRLLEVQRAGKRPVAAEAFLRGLSLPPGTRLA